LVQIYRGVFNFVPSTRGGLSILCQGNIKDFFHFLFYRHFMGKTHANLVCVIMAKQNLIRGGWVGGWVGESPVSYMKNLVASHQDTQIVGSPMFS